MSLGDPGPEFGPEDGADVFPFPELGVAAFSFASFCACRQSQLNIPGAVRLSDVYTRINIKLTRLTALPDAAFRADLRSDPLID